MRPPRRPPPRLPSLPSPSLTSPPPAQFTTKLMHNRTDPAWVTKCVDVSLKKAGLDYIDLYLIHDPTGGPDVRAAMWQGCCNVRDTGKVRAIGVRCVLRFFLLGAVEKRS